MGARRERRKDFSASLRGSGETIRLLIDTTSQRAPNPTYSNTSFSIIDEQAQQPFKSDSIIVTYGKVSNRKSSTTSYDEGGIVLIGSASIELQGVDKVNADKAWGVMLTSGERLKIDSRNFGEGRETYVLETSEETPPGM